MTTAHRSSADVVVVGAGSAGCVLAARLSDDPACRVALLEAGPALPLAERPAELVHLSRPIAWPYDWDDHVVGADGRSHHYGRGRGLGGSSATNGGVALRPAPADVDWGPGWTWPDLLGSLVAIEHDLDFAADPWHGGSGPIPIVRWPERAWNPMQQGFVAGCEAVGLARVADLNAPGASGVGAVPMNRRGRDRVSAHEAFLAPVSDRANLTVVGDAHVARIRWSGTRAIGVETTDGRVVDADHVVLAAGVIQDPLLLWRSGVGPAEALRARGIDVVAHVPAVGAHLTDHMVVTYAAAIDPATIPDDAPSLQTLATATAPGSGRAGSADDLQFTPFVRRHPDGRRDLCVSVSLQLPEGVGTVSPGSDLMGPAEIRWPFTHLPSNVARLVAGWRLAAEIAHHSGLVVDPAAVDRDRARTDTEVADLVRDEHSAFYHGVGTCRMGDDRTPDAERVVDLDARVVGVLGLSVVDAAIVPSVPRTNTNLTAMAVAHHAVTTRRTHTPSG